jgi:iron(III) transport system permease protein
MRYDTFTRIIYVQYQSFLSRGLAAALALLLIAMTAVILYFERKTRTTAVYMRVSAGAPRQPKPVQLGKWRWVALAFLSGVVGFALVLPAFGLLYWVIRGMARGEVLQSLWMPAMSSFTASTLAALLTIFLGIPVAMLAVRRSNRLSVWIEQVTYAGFALPGIVVALALVFFGANYMPSLYQTLPLLIMAYVVLFVPQAVGSIKTSLLQVPTYLEEAGRSLGQSSSQAFRNITLPLVRPGLLAGGALVFLTCMKELPATLLLSPLGFKTLSVSVWGAISEAFFAQAAMPALLLILLSSIPLALLTLRDA